MNTLLRPWRALTRSPLRRAFSIAGVALGVVFWLALAPTALGGSTTYVTTYGISMEPTLHKGDLAIVRPQASYRVGDIVAYNSASLHTVVLHRIIDRDGERFVFKGDNNTWIDTDRPTASALIGKLEMKLPGFGTHVQQMASPPGMGALATLAAIPVASKGRRRRRKDRGDADKPVRPPRSQPLWRGVDPRLLIATAAAVGVLALSFTRPPTTHVTGDMPFDDRGEFAYVGAAPGGEAVYKANTVSSGQPIFFNLVDSIDVAYSYTVSSLVPLVARGDLALGAELSDADGWTYPLELAAPIQFEGSEAHASGTLNLQNLRVTIANMQAATGVQRDAYTVRVTATVNREIRRNDAEVAGVFASSLEFRLDANEMHLAAPGGNTLTPSQGGLLSVPRVTENHFDVLGQSLSIAAMRAASLAFSLIVAALWLDTLLRAARSDETSRIERRYKNYVLPVRAAELTSELVIEVESIAALARIADHTGAPMLRRGAGAYHVVDGTRVYRYQVLALDASHTDAQVAPPDDGTQTGRPDRPLRVRRRVEA